MPDHVFSSCKLYNLGNSEIITQEECDIFDNFHVNF